MNLSWKWNLSDLKPDKDINVFSTFSCGGGSSLGYKRAGFRVLGNVEIDKKINEMYVRNNHPEYNFCMDLREFNKLENLPDKLYQLDILDGSPPCTPFSAANIRKQWGVKKRFKEGQALQILDDLFFVFLETVEKLRPKIVIAENVPGMLDKKVKYHLQMINSRFNDLGYHLQIFRLNSAVMDVPQKRERLFFIAQRMGYKELKLVFNQRPLKFGEVRSEKGKEISSELMRNILSCARVGETDLREVTQRLTGEKNRYFNTKVLFDENIAPTVTSSGDYLRFCDKSYCSDADFRAIQTFPDDYDFCGNDIKYVCGMSVPPNKMAHVANEVYEQWLA